LIVASRMEMVLLGLMRTGEFEARKSSWGHVVMVLF
jgi:hypothetical protein